MTMATEPKLEQYLSTLDKSLGQIPVSDRSDIITEIKSHVLDAKDRDPNQSIEQILASIGEPESVANRYLLERGLKPGKPARSPIVKWLTVGFLGTFGITATLIIVILWKFTPIIKVDEEAGHVVILGGLIEINEKEGKVKVGNTHVRQDISFAMTSSREFDGSSTLDKNKVSMVRVPFSNGKIEMTTSVDQQLRWKCKVNGAANSAFVSEDKKIFTINLSNTAGSKCEIQVPSGIATNIEGMNGKIEVIKPQAHLEIKMMNGKVNFTPDPQKQYRYENNVVNGKIGDFVSSTAKDAIFVKMTINNGSIEQE